MGPLVDQSDAIYLNVNVLYVWAPQGGPLTPSLRVAEQLRNKHATRPTLVDAFDNMTDDMLPKLHEYSKHCMQRGVQVAYIALENT